MDNKAENDRSKSVKDFPQSLDDLNNVSTASSHTQAERLDERQMTNVDLEKANLTAALSDDGSKTQKSPIERSDTNKSEKPYSSFNQREKILIVLCATLGGLFSPFTTNIYFPALDTIASDLRVSISLVNLTITTYMIFQAIAPTFVSTFTDTQGRRPTYVVGFIVYIGANIGLALNNTYAGLLVLRCLQSCGSSGMVTIQQAIIADVITSAERGSYISITSITGIVAPSLAPIIGGLLSQHLGWHSIFWFLLILAAVYLVPMLLFMPETSRKLVDDGSILPPRWNMSLLNVWMSRRIRGPNLQDQLQRTQRHKLKWPNPMSTFRVFADKENAMLLAVSAIAYACWYGISSSLTVQFAQIYHLNSTFQGLLFLPQAVGSLMSAVTNGILLDKNYQRYAKKLGLEHSKKKQINLVGFPIERARMELALILFIFNSLFTIAYGWLLQYEVHIAAPIAMLVFIGYTLMASFNALSVLLIDLNRHRAAATSAAGNLCRCLLGAGMTAVINPMIEAMGRGWCFTFTALVQLCFLPLILLCMRKGVEWRRAKAEKEKEKEKEKTNNEKLQA